MMRKSPLGGAGARHRFNAVSWGPGFLGFSGGLLVWHTRPKGWRCRCTGRSSAHAARRLRGRGARPLDERRRVRLWPAPGLVLPLGIGVHLAAAAATRADPYVMASSPWPSARRSASTPDLTPEAERPMVSLRDTASVEAVCPIAFPWACLVAPGVVLQKTPIFQRTLAFRGPISASSLDSELLSGERAA